jgi:hypothetical protein
MPTASATTHSRSNGETPAISPELAELPGKILSLHRPSLNLQGRFGLFVSALKIPFPRNGDFGSKRPVRMRCR